MVSSELCGLTPRERDLAIDGLQDNLNASAILLAVRPYGLLWTSPRTARKDSASHLVELSFMRAPHGVAQSKNFVR